MANVFDQFDTKPPDVVIPPPSAATPNVSGTIVGQAPVPPAKAAPSTGKNVFDQFDAPAAGKPSTTFQRLAAEAPRKLLEQSLKLQGKLPDVDYDTGIPFFEQVHFDKLDNKDERQLYLEKRYGKDNVGQDPAGTFWVNRNGKKIAVGGGGIIQNVGAEALSLGNEVALGTLGAAAGAPFGGLGAIPGAMLGTAAGKALDELTKMLEGDYAKTPGQELRRLGTEGVLGGVGEAVGMGASKIVGRLTKGLLARWFSGATPETESMVARMTDPRFKDMPAVDELGRPIKLDARGRPPLTTVMPHLKALIRKQVIADKLNGPAHYIEQGNMEYLEAQMRAALKESGVPADRLDEVMLHIMDPTTKISTTDMGMHLRAHTKDLFDTYEQASAKEMDTVDKVLSTQLKRLDVLTQRHAPGTLGINVAEGLKTLRKIFGQAGHAVYRRVDDLLGGTPIVPTSVATREAAKIMARPVLAGKPSIFKEIAELPEKISFADAQRYRTRLREEAWSGDLMPGTIKKDYSTMATLLDASIAKAGTNPAAKAGLRLLRQADKWYGENIKKFDDRLINQLVDQARSGMPPDAGKVAEMIMNPDATVRAGQIIDLLPPGVRRQVRAADFDNMVSASTIDSNGLKVVRPKLLRQQVELRKAVFDKLYGKQLGGEIRNYLTRLAARDGEIPAHWLANDNFGTALKAAVAHQAALDKLTSEAVIARMANPNQMPDDVLRWLVKPGAEDRLGKVIAHFGEGSPQVDHLRQVALQVLLHSAIDRTGTGVGKTVSGDAIENALSAYTVKQQAMLFPNGMADDIRLIAKATRGLFPKSADDSMAGWWTGALLNLPLGLRYPFQIYYGAWNAALRSPTVLRFISLGLQDRSTRDATLRTLKGLADGELPSFGDVHTMVRGGIREGAEGAARTATPGLLTPDIGGDQSEGQ